ncbi:hypothetical protein, unlikely [Trypanosoma congolense IL3000]|uniref:Uncharacterized protein n=1 Tax=Trypanosoma congolense (strain IL3000) TaxID=1068625 RepID=F9WHP9_TRYCI|nr:hypothetical protein, unlikely [Trypanosoma congolense IL3000]
MLLRDSGEILIAGGAREAAPHTISQGDDRGFTSPCQPLTIIIRAPVRMCVSYHHDAHNEGGEQALKRPRARGISNWQGAAGSTNKCHVGGTYLHRHIPQVVCLVVHRSGDRTWRRGAWGRVEDVFGSSNS